MSPSSKLLGGLFGITRFEKARRRRTDCLLVSTFAIAGVVGSSLGQPFPVGILDPQWLNDRPCADNTSFQNTYPMSTQRNSPGFDPPCGSDNGPIMVGGMPQGSSSPQNSFNSASPSPSQATMAADAATPQMSVDSFHMTVRLSVPGLAFPNRIPMNAGGVSYNGRYGYNGNLVPTLAGVQGFSWFQETRPEFENHGHSGGHDEIYIHTKADKNLEFKWRCRPNGTDACPSYPPTPTPPSPTPEDGDCPCLYGTPVTSGDPCQGEELFRCRRYVWTGFNGTMGSIQQIRPADGSNDPGVYEYADPNGLKYTFIDHAGLNGTAGNSGKAAGQLWKIETADGDASGAAMYVGSRTDITTALSKFGYEGTTPTDPTKPGPYLSEIFDSSGRRWTYSYVAVPADSSSRLIRQIVVQENISSVWTEVGRMEYDYYTTTGTHGLPGDLKTVKAVVTLSNGQSSEAMTYFRYYTPSTANSYSNHNHLVKLVVAPEGVRRFSGGISAVESATDAALKPYAAGFFEYEKDTSGNPLSRRLSKSTLDGGCGCSGSSSGEYLYSQEFGNTSFSSTYDTHGDWDQLSGTTPAWRARTIITSPDNTKSCIYYDRAGQILGKVIAAPLTSGLPNDQFIPSSTQRLWITKYIRDQQSRILEVITPEAMDWMSYLHDGSATRALGYMPVKLSGGLSVEGLVYHKRWLDDPYVFNAIVLEGHSKGRNGQLFADVIYTYVGGSATGWKWDFGPTNFFSGRLVRNLPASIKTVTSNDTPATLVSGVWTVPSGTFDEVTFSYSNFYTASNPREAPWNPRNVVVTEPVVSTAMNGSGTTTTTSRYLDRDGRTVFSVDQFGDRFQYTEYQASTGLLVRAVKDPKSGTGLTAMNTAATGFGITLPSGGLHLESTFAYDIHGRVTESVDPAGRVRSAFYTKLSDGRLVTLSVPLRTGTSPSFTYSSPVDYAVQNFNGGTEASGVLSFSGGTTTSAPDSWTSETSADPIACVTSPATLSRLSTRLYDSAGVKVQESRLYTQLTGTPTFDSTTYTYDAMSRPYKVTDATQTISTTVFDALGRTAERWVGTNDSTSNNMSKVSTLVYDEGGVGNSKVTRQIQHPDSTNMALDRLTDMLYDYRGRPSVAIAPVAPHSVTKFDNLGRSISRSLYSSASGLTVSTDPESQTTNRVSFAKSFYDPRGMQWKSETDRLNTSGVVDGTLVSLNWYDQAGRLVKTRGSSLLKMQYDRLGAAVRSYVLASDDDSGAWSAASTVAGDRVVEQTDTYLDPMTRNKFLSVSISRHPNDTTGTGALNTATSLNLVDFASGAIKGRAQIQAMYYDSMDRTIASVSLGTNGQSNYDRAASANAAVPTSTSTVLVARTAYNADGTVSTTTDPNGIVTAYGYDDAGRKIRTTENFFSGGSIGSGANQDQNRVTKYTYANGLMTELRAATNDNAANDQVTKYVYGVTKSTATTPFPSSRVASNRLLRVVAYPDSSNLADPGNASATDVVRYAYNALSEQVWTKDQAGNEIQTSFDTGGRQTQRFASTIITPAFDDLVRKIQLAYDPLGRVSTVTQLAASDATVDQVSYAYDSWGNVLTFAQDPDSALGTSSGRDSYSVGYDLAIANPSNAANLVRRTALKLNYATLATYNYGTSGQINDALSRVQSISVGGVTVATYDYMGAGTVVSQTLNQPNLYSSTFDPSTITYPGLDRFNRTIQNWWRRNNPGSGISKKIFDSEIRYDRNSNITATLDNVHQRNNAGNRHIFDVVYANDNLNRLRGADEGHLVTNPTTLVDSIETGYRQRNELWANLMLTGNWGNRRLDANGDGLFNGAADRDETPNVFNAANEWTSRRARSTPTQDDFDYTYDAVGNLVTESKTVTSGGSVGNTQGYYVYDPFGRLRRIETLGFDPETEETVRKVIAEYRYNGLGFRTMWKYDANANGSLADSERYYFAYDERWRVVATYRDTDSVNTGSLSPQDRPKERFLYHAAGMGGMGGSSFIDAVVFRDRDANTAWTAAGDGALEERRFYCQNWRGDVIGVAKDTETPVEWVRYSSYGEPMVYPLADLNRDGIVNSTDTTIWGLLKTGGSSAAAVTSDLNFDGVAANTADDDAFNESFTANSGKSGVGKVSSDAVGNRIGYAAYQWDPVISAFHVRHRVYKPEIGRWMRRDPIGYIDGSSLYQYCKSSSVRLRDTTGLYTGNSGTQPGDSCNPAENNNRELILHDNAITPYNVSPDQINQWKRFKNIYDAMEAINPQSCLGTVVNAAIKVGEDRMFGDMGDFIVEAWEKQLAERNGASLWVEVETIQCVCKKSWFLGRTKCTWQKVAKEWIKCASDDGKHTLPPDFRDLYIIPIPVKAIFDCRNNIRSNPPPTPRWPPGTTP